MIFKKAYTGPVNPTMERVTFYDSADSVADCQGAELYLEQLMYQYPYNDALDRLHSLIKNQQGVDDGTCVELAKKAEKMIKQITAQSQITLREVLEQLVDPSYSVEDITGLTHNAKDLLEQLPDSELDYSVYWDGPPPPVMDEGDSYPPTSKIYWVEEDGTILEPHVFEVFVEIDRIDPFNEGSNFKPHGKANKKGVGIMRRRHSRFRTRRRNASFTAYDTAEEWIRTDTQSVENDVHRLGLEGSWQKDPKVAALIERGTELGYEVTDIVTAVAHHIGDTSILYRKDENSPSIWDVVRNHVEAYDAEREAYAKRIAKKRHRASRRSCCGRSLHKKR